MKLDKDGSYIVKVCKKCGSNPRWGTKKKNFNKTLTIECTKCDNVGSTGKTTNEAIKNWDKENK